MTEVAVPITVNGERHDYSDWKAPETATPVETTNPRMDVKGKLVSLTGRIIGKIGEKSLAYSERLGYDASGLSLYAKEVKQQLAELKLDQETDLADLDMLVAKMENLRERVDYLAMDREALSERVQSRQQIIDHLVSQDNLWETGEDESR